MKENQEIELLKAEINEKIAMLKELASKDHINEGIKKLIREDMRYYEQEIKDLKENCK